MGEEGERTADEVPAEEDGDGDAVEMGVPRANMDP